MNYAKTQPELVILAVNTFVKVRLGCELGLIAGYRRPQSFGEGTCYPYNVGPPSRQDLGLPRVASIEMSEG
jgi:hypothetical protein